LVTGGMHYKVTQKLLAGRSLQLLDLGNTGLRKLLGALTR
jgi:hypothetical protein